MNENIDKKIIPIDQPKAGFESFLSDENNRRIFFSGKFGIGKTFFLQSFFEEHKDKYDVYHLYPIRYQISSNENIIELLKYDVLVELLKKYPNAFTDNPVGGLRGQFQLFASFCKDYGSINGFLKSIVSNGSDALSLVPDPFLQSLSKLGRPLNELLDLDKSFQEFKKEYTAGEKGNIEKFVEEIQVIDSSSTDYTSHLIKEKIANLKGEKRSVLIIDDFERIDPDHIFRILNILSAHMEGDDENKFGFNHIIIVGDVRNIKSIFHHKYGTLTEFDGYFNKFFSVTPFYFDNDKAIKDWISQMVIQIKNKEPNLNKAIAVNGTMSNFLGEVLGSAFEIKKLNLRNLFSPTKYCFPELQEGVYGGSDGFNDAKNMIIDISIRLFISICGGKDESLEILREISKSSLKNKKKVDWLYRDYSTSMLRYLLPDLKEEGQQIKWLEKYDVIASMNQHRSYWVDIYPVENEKIPHSYFYDTLIKYIEEEKHNKEWREYLD